ncbi:hypothetical protein l11_07780 [Neisseria weaveri LMG 5135]|nr:hypothetical protein l11_07780 [Neisseria weaveri LMG 5135]
MAFQAGLAHSSNTAAQSAWAAYCHSWENHSDKKFIGYRVVGRKGGKLSL